MANPRCLVGAAVLICAGLCVPAAEAALTMTQTTNEIEVTSTAGATWRAVIAIAPNASSSNPGGGVTRALYIPATSTQNIVDGGNCCSALGLDNLEWRYIDGGGIRADMGRKSTIDSLTVLENTSTRIVIRMQGSWRNISSFVRTTTIDPDGIRTELEATWDGPTGFKSMWWLLGILRSDRIDGDQVTIQDANTGPIPLPYKKECICNVPSGIDFPYTVSFPFRSGPASSMELNVVKFDDTNSSGKRYEFWPEQSGHYFFFPRWVSQFQKRLYRFEYRWSFSGDGGGTLPPATVIVSPAVSTDLVEGQTYTFTGTGDNLVWTYDGISDGQVAAQFGTGQSATFSVPTGISGVIIILSGDGGTVQQTYNIVPGANTPPTATFSHSPNPAFVGDTVSFDASGSLGGSGGAITNYTWDLDDGTAVQSGPSLSNVTHVYTSAGTYDVTLTVTNAAGSDMVTVQLVIGEPDTTPPLLSAQGVGFSGTVDDPTLTTVQIGPDVVALSGDTFDGELVLLGATGGSVVITTVDTAGNTGTRTLTVTAP